MSNVKGLLPAIYSLEASLAQVNAQIKYIRDLVEEYPPSPRHQQGVFEERLAALMDHIVGTYGASQPNRLDFWVRAIDAVTGGLVRQIDEGRFTPRAKQAVRVAFTEKFQESARLVFTSPPPAPVPDDPVTPTAEEQRRTAQVALELATFQLKPINFDFSSDDYSSSV